jgi:hypothetical protein
MSRTSARALVHTAVQLVGAGLLLAGLYALLGLAWTMTVTGGALLLASVLVEALSGASHVERSRVSGRSTGQSTTVDEG